MGKIRTLGKHLKQLEKNDVFRIGIKAAYVKAKTFKNIDVSSIGLNQSFLPLGSGSVLRFNANGKYIIRKDLPKESRYINSREWTYKKWTGGGQTETVTETVDVYRDCYPKEFILPPSEELIKTKVGSDIYLVSREFKNSSSNESKIIHILNIFLELFADFEIIKDGVSLTDSDIKKVNWKLLPPGKDLWNKVMEHIKTQNKRSPAFRNVVIERQEFLKQFKPKNIFQGIGGFSDYLAYEYKGFSILDSITIGNALYLFNGDWRDVSQLTKSEIINNKLAKDRIVHTKGWKEKVSAHF